MSCQCSFCKHYASIWGVSVPEHAEPPSMEPVEESETVVGHRLWRWTPDDGLIGPSGVPWKKSFMRAVCLSYGHPAPHGWEPPTGTYTTGRNAVTRMSCWCGINAYKLTEAFELSEISYVPGELPVVGIVELGGTVDEYDRGYRAQYGQIQELTVLTGLPVDTTVLEMQYDVPVRAMGYEDWRKEWELTYGRDRAEGSGDRESSETDNDSEAGAATYASAFHAATQGALAATVAARAQGTSTSVSKWQQNWTAALQAAASPQWTNAQLDNLLKVIKETPEPKWYRKLWWKFQDWRDGVE